MMQPAFSRHFQSVFARHLGTRIVVALSGGPDSVALLHLLLDPALQLDLHVVHVHHGVRGLEADGDAGFCGRLCADLGLPFHLRRIAPPERPPEGREAAWRRLRYEILRTVAVEVDASAVATGHQGDDVAEGVLVQMLRGAGPRAMAGIAAEAEGWIIRPLLPWSRMDVLRWLEEEGFEWREDSSNRSPVHLRNRVRDHVLPRLREVEPRIARHLAALAGDLARDEAHFAALLEELGLWIDPWDPGGGVEVSRLGALDGALLPRWLHAQVARAGLGKATRRQAELLERLVRRGRPRAVTLAGRWRLYRARGRLWLEPPGRPAPYAQPLLPGIEVELPFPGWSIVARRFPPPTEEAQSRTLWRQAIPASKGLALRCPLPGDRVGGGGRRRKLASLLARRLPRHLRSSWPVIHAGATILWVPGVWTAPGTAEEAVLDVEVRRQ